jgi:hypothetical protein
MERFAVSKQPLGVMYCKHCNGESVYENCVAYKLDRNRGYMVEGRCANTKKKGTLFVKTLVGLPFTKS